MRVLQELQNIISSRIWVITIVTLLITPLITTHEPPSSHFLKVGLLKLEALNWPGRFIDVLERRQVRQVPCQGLAAGSAFGAQKDFRIQGSVLKFGASGSNYP